MMTPQLPDWQDFTLTGELGQRLQRAVARMLELQPRLYTETRIVADYGYGEIAANWLETMALLCRHTGGQYAAPLRAVAEELLTHQQPYGGFCAGVEDPSSKIGYWVGDQRALGGLLAAWRVLGEGQFLEAAGRVAGYLMRHWPEDFRALAANSWGELKYRVEPYFYSTSNVVDLYAATGTADYLDFARRICLAAPRLHAGAELEHADGRMVNLLGLLRLYGVTGDKALLDAVLHDQRIIATQFIWPSGGSPEMLPDNRRDEACQTANWARLNLALWDLTGESGYVALAERTWQNHLYFSQHPSGGFCWGRTLRRGGAIGQRMTDTGEPFEMWYCCSETAPRALLDLGRHAVTLRAGQPAIALWAGGTYRLPGCRVEIARDLAPGEPLEVTCESEKPGALAMRLPARTEVERLEVNGTATVADARDGWLILPPDRRTSVTLAVRCLEGRETHVYARVVTPGGDANNPDAQWDPGAPVNYVGARTARFHGPWMLKADEDEDEIFEPNRRYFRGGRGQP